MTDPTLMSGTATLRAAPLRCDSVSGVRFRERMLVAMMLCATARCPCAMADDNDFTARPSNDLFGPASVSSRLLTPTVSISQPWSPLITAMNPPPDTREYSATEFRPRKPSMFDAPVTTLSDSASLPSLHTTTVWQRLQEYRSHDRVRLLTVWETPGSSVSIQTNKRGDPSLQWSSRAMNRGGATRGLFDSLMTFSLGGGGGGNGWRNVPRSFSAAAAPMAKPLPPVTTAGVK